mgnify:CR=1 FL=1
MFAYRILKKLFLPAYGDANNQRNNTRTQQQNTYHNYTNGNKSNVIEDVDYEEVD